MRRLMNDTKILNYDKICDIRPMGQNRYLYLVISVLINRMIHIVFLFEILFYKIIQWRLDCFGHRYQKGRFIIARDSGLIEESL